MASIPHKQAPLTALIAALVAVCLLLGSCDNPACVFGGDCSGTTNPVGTLGTEAAQIPPDHAWILTGAPRVTDFFPKGGAINTETPVAVVFSESMAAQTLVTSVALFSTSGFGTPVFTHPPALVGDGRMLVVAPLAPLDPDETYELRYTADSVVTDLTGTVLSQDPDRVIGSFTVAATDTNFPRVLTTWPVHQSDRQSATGEIVTVFDREVLSNTVTSQSYALTVDVGAGPVTPVPNPKPLPVLLIGPGAFPTSDNRFWTMRKEDAEGNALSLGAGGAVHLELSPDTPAGNKIVAVSGGSLINQGFDHDIAVFSAPVAAEIVSNPTDAIGIENLNQDLTNDLDVAATLEGQQDSDLIGIFLFGRSPSTGDLITLFREVSVGNLTVDPMSMVATLTEAELDIASSSSPVTSRFADGVFAIALRTQRANNFSPVRMLDVEMDIPGPQNALLDTTQPTFTAFGSTGSDQVNFVSDLRHLAVLGRSSEELRSVEVFDALGMDNSMLPPVVGTNSSGLFVAAPVNLGVVDPALQPVSFNMDLYDRALNLSTAQISGSFIQRGAVGPGTALPAMGAFIDVEVFDQRTLDLVSGATVFVHDDNAGVVTFVATQTTTATGLVSLLAGANQTVVTVEAPGYDIVTYHGVPVSRISVPLRRNTESPGAVLGTASSQNATVTGVTLHVDDSRQLEGDEPLVGGSWILNAPLLTYEADYGPALLRLGAARAVSAVGIVPPPTNFPFNAQTFLRAYSLELPFPGPSAGGTTTVDFSVEPLLDDAAQPLEELAIAGPQTTLDATGMVGVDLMDLDGDPRVWVDARVRSMHGSALAGAGAVSDLLVPVTGMWDVDTAVPGLADPDNTSYVGDQLGELITDGTIDPDLFLRLEVRDNAGNLVGLRPRFPVPGVGATAIPLDVARLTSPIGGGSTGAQGFNLVVEDSISTSAAGDPGLYRATLVDSAAQPRIWTLYRAAGPGVSRRIAVPDLAADGGVGLQDGPLACTVEAWAWGSFDETAFLFSDIEREHDGFSASAPITFTKP